jgi:hypothetical protein
VSENRASAPDRARIAEIARHQVRRAILSTVRETGGHSVTRPAFSNRPDLDLAVSDAEPMAALRITAAIGQALRRISSEHVRRAREDGHCWRDIGAALGLEHARDDGLSIAEAAYDQVAGEPGFRARSFVWVCPACCGTVIDRGPEAGRPEDCEEGHAPGCERLATAIDAWDAQWNAEDLQ